MAIITVANPVPSIPGSVTIAPNFFGFEISFDRPTDPDFLGVKVYVDTLNGFTPGAGNLKYDGPHAKPILISGLLQATQYYIKFVLYDVFGDSGVSTQYSTTTLSISDGNAPTVPNGGAAPTVSSIVRESKLYATGELKISWTASTDDSGKLFYRVEFWTDVNKKTVVETQNLDYTVFPAEIGVEYSARVQAVDYSGNESSFGATATHTITADGTAPANVTGVVLTAGFSGVLVEWVNPTDADFIETQVYRGTSSGFTPNDGTNLVARTRATSFFDADIVNGTAYYYKFKTRDVQGNVSTASAASGPVTPFNISSANIGSFMADAAIIGDKVAARTLGVQHLYVGSFDNLAQNPGFEQSSAETPHQFSNGGGAWSVDTTNPRSGAQCAKFDPTGQSAGAEIRVNGVITDQTKHYAVAEGDKLYIEAWVRSDSTPANDVDIVIDWRDETAAQLATTSSADTTPTTSYQKFSIVGTAPAGVAYAVARLRVLNGGNAGIVRIDDIYIRRMVEGSIIVDGTLTASKIAALTITANEIAASTIVGSKIAASTITADKMSVSQLSAIAADLGTITAGTVTGATIRTAASGERVQLDATNGIQAYDSGSVQRVSIKTDGSGWLGSSTALFWDTAGNLTVGALNVEGLFYSYTKTITATGAGTITIPQGARTLVIRAWGGCGGGAKSNPDTSNGGGGGGGGSKKTVAIQSSDWGQQISFDIGGGGAGRSTVGNGSPGVQTTVTSSGLSFTNLNIDCNGGAAGTTSAGGGGGTASGGDTNVTGSAGTFLNNGVGGNHALIDNIRPGKGGNGADGGTSGTGSDGRVSFTFEG